jgi:hypothetical protein
MDATMKKLLALLESDRPVEVRGAAALVLGEVAEKDAAVGKALAESLQDEAAAVRLRAIAAVSKLKIEGALSRLLERIKVGGEEADAAAHAAARLGARGTRGLQELMPKVAPGLRRYIAAALAAGGTASSETAALAVLQNGEPGVIDSALRTLVDQVPTLTSAHKTAWTNHLLEILDDSKSPLPPHAEIAVVRLLVALGDPRAEEALWGRVLSPHPHAVRAAALQALAQWVKSPSKEQLKKVFACAADPDFRVVAPALYFLKSQTPNPKALGDWLSLLQARDVAARVLALEKLADVDTAAVADAVAEQLGHPDRNLREKALALLTRHAHGRTALTRALLDAEQADQAWALARGQAPFLKAGPSDWRDKVFARACEYVEADDRRADPLLFLLRETDAHDLRDRLEQRAEHWRKKKDYAAAQHYLRLLTRDPACAFPVRLALAACTLKLSSKELTAEDRNADPALHQFASLLQHHGPDLFGGLEKLKWLDPEDLFYVGFHFAEHEGGEKKFAGEVLRLVVQRAPKSKTAQAAKRKLKSAGL